MKGVAGVPLKDMLALKNLAVQQFLMPPPSTALSLLPTGVGSVDLLVESERGVDEDFCPDPNPRASTCWY